MKKVAAILVGVVFLNSYAFAGLVSFDPEKASVLPGEAAVFGVTLVSETLGDIQGADVVLGSDDVPFGFQYSDEWTSAMGNVSAITPLGIFPFDLFVGGNNPLEPIGLSSILLGTVTADTTGLAVGQQYSIFVDSSRDGFSSIGLGTTFDPISGTGLINVVPEPVTLSLLGLGALALLRRRRTA